MTPTTAHSRKTWAIALFAGILLAMRIGVARSGIAASLDGQLRPALLSFALLLAPLWFFGFGLGEWLAQRLRSPWSRVAFPALLGVPYLVFAFPAGTLRWSVAIVVFLLPVVLSATLESSASTRNLVWQDGLVLGTLAAVYLFRLFTPAWPYAGLACSLSCMSRIWGCISTLSLENWTGLGTRLCLAGIRFWSGCENGCTSCRLASDWARC